MPNFVRDASPDELYEEAAKKYSAALARLARAYEADPERRRDLLQEIHFAIWRSFESFQHRCSLQTWIHQVAHNTAVAHVVRQKRIYAGLVGIEDIEMLPASARPEPALERQSTVDRIMELIHRLKPIDRQVILSYLEDMDAKTIAEITGLSPGNVAMKVHRVKTVLARQFQRGDSHAR